MSPNGKYDPDAAPLMDASEIRMELHELRTFVTNRIS